MLEVKNLSKCFDGNYVLKNVSIKIAAGEVYGLIGANGSGKSTFMNILNGNEMIASTGGYEGEILIDGVSVRINDHRQSSALGIAMVHQELALFFGMSVAENIKINRENIRRRGLVLPEFSYIDQRKNIEDAARTLEGIGAKIDPRRLIDGLPLNQKQFVELARELDNRNIRLLILDEPTSSLNVTETKALLGSVREIACRGIAVIFISHRLDEIMDICDTVSVLRDGALVSTYKKAEFSIGRFAADMVDCKIVKARRPQRHEAREVLMRYSDLPNGSRDLEIYDGEILGITGLAGQGQEQFSEGLFGLKPADYSVCYQGAVLRKGDNAALTAKGICFLSDDRARTNLLGASPIWKNMVFGTERRHPEFLRLRRCRALSFLNRKAIEAHTRSLIEKLNIVCTGPEQPVRQLSGGNQQKVCIGRAITFAPKLLFVGEPTRGIDIYSKELILDRLQKMNELDKTTVVITSGEIEELSRICDRVVVMYQGSVFKVFEGNMDQEQITRSLYGREADES